jgi:hypothetical protein
MDTEPILGENYLDSTLPFSDEKRRSYSYYTDVGDDIEAYLKVLT